jgi:hypothetical protein
MTDFDLKALFDRLSLTVTECGRYFFREEKV